MTLDHASWALLTALLWPEIFDVVQAEQAGFGVVPFENSTHGPVTFTLDSLADREDTHGDLVVCGEGYLPVHHFLLGRRPSGSRTGSDESQSPGTCTPTAAHPTS